MTEATTTLTRAASPAASSNKAVLDKIRASTPPAPSRSHPAPAGFQPAPQHAPTRQPQWQQQKPQEKGIVSKLFDWLFG